MSSTETSKTYGPYSPVRVVGDVIYVSGQVGISPEAKTAEHDVISQTQQVMKNLKSALASVDLTLADIVKTTIYLRDMADFTEVNEIYSSYLSEPYPARACVEVSGLPRVCGDSELLVEIEAIAQKRQSS